MDGRRCNPPAQSGIDGTGEFFHVRIDGGQTLTAGSPSVSLGHDARMAGASGREGIFAEWCWDGKSLCVRTDRYGICPIFYFNTGREFAVASSISALLAILGSDTVDYDAMAVFLRLGFFLDEDTPFQRIRALAPAACLVWESGSISYSTARPVVSRGHLSRGRAIEGYIELFRQAVERRLPDTSDYCLPLSGGRDSRHILLELVRAGQPPHLCVTVDRERLGYEHECEVAEGVAAAVKVRHGRLRAPRSYLAADRWAIRRQHYCSDEGGWYRPCAEFLLRKTKVSYDGIAGDIWAECTYNTRVQSGLFRESDSDAIARDLLDFWRRDAYIGMLLNVPAYRAMSRERAVARVSASLALHRDSPNPLASFYFWNRTRRKVALMPLTVLSQIEIHCPYLDGDLFDFVSSLPSDVMQSGGFHTAVIARAYPQFAYLPYSDAPRFRQSTAGTARDLLYVAQFLVHIGLLARKRIARSRFLSPTLLSTLGKSPSIRFVRRAMNLALYVMDLEERLATPQAPAPSHYSPTSQAS